MSSVSLLVKGVSRSLKGLGVEISGSETELKEVGDAIGCGIKVGERGFPHSHTTVGVS